MERVAVSPRPDWQARVEALGFDWHSAPSPEDPVGRYWDESACWRLTVDEVDLLEAATTELHGMCVAATGQALARGLLPGFGFKPDAIALIEDSWRRRDDDQPSLYGRFDFAFGGAGVGDGQPKMLEYNAETPTGLYEAAVVQWTWLEECFPDSDQFNSLHEGLVAAWGKLKGGLIRTNFESLPVHFTCLMPHPEDEGTLRYMLDTALEAGLAAKTIAVSDVGWSAPVEAGDVARDVAFYGRFVDLEDTPITTLFKIVPLDWLLADEFGAHLIQATMQRQLTVIEPAWKMVAANKAILAVLWEMYPGHPHLLPAFMDRRAFEPGATVVAKPLLGREGANISITVLGENGAPDGAPLATSGGTYGEEGYVYQAHAPLATAPGPDGTTNYAVIGSWVIDGVSRGLGIREEAGLITHNRSRFVPHLF